MKRHAYLLVIALAGTAIAQPNLEPSVENDGPSAIDPLQLLEQYNNMRQGTGSGGTSNAESTENAVNRVTGWAQWGINTLRTWHDLEQNFPPLTADDASCMDLSTLGAPVLPASCSNPSSGCGKCYSDAERELNGMRVNLERLKCYYSAYKRFVDASIAFGDSASGIHAVTGLEWQTQRAGIVAEFANLKHAYDQKYHDMLPNLRAALEHVGQCEAEFFHEPDWYARFGNLYFAFMADRYKRPE